MVQRSASAHRIRKPCPLDGAGRRYEAEEGESGFPFKVGGYRWEPQGRRAESADFAATDVVEEKTKKCQSF